MGSVKTTHEEVSAMAFITYAIEFQKEADKLYGLRDESAPASNPLYHLLFHTVELALKGYLRVNGWMTEDLARRDMGHYLGNLYRKCGKLTLGLAEDESRSIEAVISLLDQGNENQGLRYFTPTGRGLSEITWTWEVVHAIVRAAQEAVLAAGPSALTPGMGK
jgi:hypothetical protein